MLLPKRDGWIAVGLGVLTACYSWALLSAIDAIPLALAILIFYLFPLVATMILGVFGWEPLGWRTIAAIVVAFIGLILALDPSVVNINMKGVWLGFAAAVGLGIVVAVSSRVFRAGDSRPVTLYMATVSAILLIAFCAQQGDIALPTTPVGQIGFVAAIMRRPNWKSNDKTAVGKGATAQQFFATVGGDKLEIEVAPWGEGHLKVNGREIARVTDAKDRRQAFHDLDKAAERYLSASGANKAPSMIPPVRAKLLEDKRGLIVGIANENSIAWGCAKAFRAFGAELAVTYLNDKAKKYVEPLARELEAPIMVSRRA